MFAGQMACEACNWLLKRYIKEERPQRKFSTFICMCSFSEKQNADKFFFIATEMNGKGYGMPSSHAQFVSFFSVYLTLFLLLRHQPHPTHTHTPLTLFERFHVSLLALVSAASVAASRIYLNYHTPKQVLVGSVAGAILAIGWFMVVAYIRSSGWLEWALETDLAKAFRMRDLVVTEDLMDAGWLRWREMRKKRSVEKKR